MSTWFLFLCQISIIASAVVGGVFLAFSDFIMRSLAATSPPVGAEVMQVINREVFKYVSIPLFLCMAAVSPVIIGYSYAYLTGPVAMLLMCAAGLYIVGVFGVTVFFNVPLNKLLEAKSPSSEEALMFWKNSYLTRWTFWNGVRAFASILAAGLFLFALVWGRP